MRKKIFTFLLALVTSVGMMNAAVDGKLSGAFSVDYESTVVYFSQGNLQATYDGSAWTWAFAANQYDYIGNAAANNAINGNGTVSTNGTIDLFGWSTSTTFYGIHNSTDNGTYYASFVDWSSNTDLIASLGGDWRTLTSSEWGFLLDYRTTTSGVRYAKATVNSVAGLIILPDNWDVAYHALVSTNDPYVDFSNNIISSAEWTDELEAHGAVFLPAAGNRSGTNVSEAGSACYYWSATSIDVSTANYMLIDEYDLSASSFNLLYYGRSVRLVSETAPTPPNPTVQINGSWNWSDPWLTFTDNGNGTASVTKELTASSTPYEFGLHINDAWATNGYAFHCGYTSVDNFAHDALAGNMTLRADMSGVYTFTYTYATNTFSITFPKTTMKGSWDSWADAVEFTPNSNGESAWVTKNFTTEGYYTFKINVGDDDWRGTDVTLSRKNMSATGIAANAANITLYVDEPGDYSFQWTFASNTLELTLVPDATNKALTTKEDPKNPGVWYSTFYHSMNRYQLPAGVEAYVATVSGETMNLTKIAEAGQVLPENTAVILKADAENISLIPTDATPVSYSATNNLHGVDVVTEIAAAVSGTCYVLSGNSTDGVGFFKYQAPNQLKAHKAYIDLNGSGMAQAPKHLRFVYDQATGIENTNAAVECQKLIENGQLIIIKNGVKYNAQGQIVK